MEEILRKKKNMSSARRTLLAFDRGSLMNIHRPIAGGVMTIENAHNKRLQRTRLSVALPAVLSREAAAGNDAVDLRMMEQLPGPGVEHADHPEACAGLGPVTVRLMREARKSRL